MTDNYFTTVASSLTGAWEIDLSIMKEHPNESFNGMPQGWFVSSGGVGKQAAGDNGRENVKEPRESGEWMCTG